MNTYTRLEQAVDGAWMVIEAVPEEVELKRTVFSELDRVTDPNTALRQASMLSSAALALGLTNGLAIYNVG